MQLDNRGTEPRDPRETLGFLEADALAPDPVRWRLHPAFDAALALTATGLVELYAGNRIFNRLLADKGRVVFAHFVLYLHALPESEGGGLTAARMAALCAEMKICSRGRARALLSLMHWGGQITPLDRPRDRREKPLAPTDQMVSLQAKRWKLQFRSIALIDPLYAAVPGMLENRAFFDQMIIAMGLRYRSGYRLLDHAPALDCVAERDGGLMVLVALLVRAGDGGPPPAIAELARAFHISRAQVLQVLRVAEGQGLVERGDSGAGSLTPAGRSALGDFFLALFVLLANCAREALHAFPRET